MTTDTKDFDVADGPADPAANQTHEARMQRLLAQVRGRPVQVQAPAELLKVEVDGELVAETPLSETPRAFDLASDARSLTLRDEHGVARAHVLLQEQDIHELAFDQDRLLLSVERGGASETCLRVVVHSQHAREPHRGAA